MTRPGIRFNSEQKPSGLDGNCAIALCQYVSRSVLDGYAQGRRAGPSLMANITLVLHRTASMHPEAELAHALIDKPADQRMGLVGDRDHQNDHDEVGEQEPDNGGRGRGVNHRLVEHHVPGKCEEGTPPLSQRSPHSPNDEQSRAQDHAQQRLPAL